MKKFISMLIASGVFWATPVFADALEDKPSSADILAASTPSDWRKLDPENTLYIDLERGRIVIALSSQLAQAHVAQIKALARGGFYDGLSFYRVIDGFVAQGGDAFETREIKNAAKILDAEFDEDLSSAVSFTAVNSDDGYAQVAGFVESLPTGVDKEAGKVWLLHCTGAIAMARNNEKDSASTEFYITLQPQRYLDRNLTVFGRVVQGMEYLQALRRVSPPESEEDDMGETIVAIRVAADMPEEDRVKLEILDSATETFATYVEARRNRPEAFFYYRPDHIDICQIAVPVRAVVQE